MDLDALRAAQEALSARSAARLGMLGEQDAALERELAQARGGQAALAQLSEYLRRTGRISEGETFSVAQLQAISRNAAAVEFAQLAYDYMQSISREGAPPTPEQLDALQAWWRSIREAALSSVGRGDYVLPAATRLSEWTGGEGQDAAALERTVAELVTPGVVTLALLRRVKELKAVPRERLPASALPLMAFWNDELSRVLTRDATAMERELEMLARQRGYLSSTDASQWPDAGLDESRVAFLRGTLRDGANRPVAELAAEWRSIIGSASARAQTASVVERLRAQEAELRAVIADIRVGLALEDPAASLAALGRVRAFFGRDGGNPGYEVLDAEWARTAAADPENVRRLGGRLAEGSRDRLLLTSLDQYRDFLQRQVGENLTGFLQDRGGRRGLAGVALLERLAQSYAGKERLRDEWTALANAGGRFTAEDLQDGERLFLQLQRSGAELKTVLADGAGFMPASMRSLGLDYAPFVRAVNPEIVSLRYASDAPVMAGPGAGTFGPGVLVRTSAEASRRYAGSAPREERVVFTALGGQRRLVREGAGSGGYAEFLRPASGDAPAVKIYLDQRTGRYYTRDDAGALRAATVESSALQRVYAYSEERLRREPLPPGSPPQSPWIKTREAEYASSRPLRLDHDGTRLSLIARGVERVDAETGTRAAATVTIDDLSGVEVTEWASRRVVSQPGAGVTTFYNRSAGAWVPTRRLATDETTDAAGVTTRRRVVEVYSGPGLWIKYGRSGEAVRETGAPLGATLELPRWRGSEAARQRIISDAASRAAAALQRRMPLNQSGTNVDVTALTADYFRRFFDGEREGRGFVGIGADRSIYTRGSDGVARLAMHRMVESEGRAATSLLTVMGMRDGRVTGIERAYVQLPNGTIVERRPETVRHVENNDFLGGALLGRTHTDRTQISIGGAPLVLEEKEVRFNQRGGGVGGWFRDYGLLGIVTLQPATDWVGYGVEVGLIAAGVDPAKARFFGELTAGVLDFAAGMATMGPGMAKLWTLAQRAGNMAKLLYVAGATTMAGYGLYATGRAVVGLNDAIHNGDWAGAGIALRGIVGNIDMLVSPIGALSFHGGRLHFQMHGRDAGGMSFRETINPPEAPRGPPDAPVAPADAPRPNLPPDTGGAVPAPPPVRNDVPGDAPAPTFRPDPAAPGNLPAMPPPGRVGDASPGPAPRGDTNMRFGDTSGITSGGAAALNIGRGGGDIGRAGPQSNLFGAGGGTPPALTAQEAPTTPAPAAAPSSPAPTAPVAAALPRPGRPRPRPPLTRQRPRRPTVREAAAPRCRHGLPRARRQRRRADRRRRGARPARGVRRRRVGQARGGATTRRRCCAPLTLGASASRASATAAARRNDDDWRARSDARRPRTATRRAPTPCRPRGRRGARRATGRVRRPTVIRPDGYSPDGYAPGAVASLAPPAGAARLDGSPPHGASARRPDGARGRSGPVAHRRAHARARRRVRPARRRGALPARVAPRADAGHGRQAVEPRDLLARVDDGVGAFNHFVGRLLSYPAALTANRLGFGAIGNLLMQPALQLQHGPASHPKVRALTGPEPVRLWVRHDPYTGAIVDAVRAAPDSVAPPAGAGAWSSLTARREGGRFEVLAHGPLQAAGATRLSAFAKQAHAHAFSQAQLDAAVSGAATRLIGGEGFRRALQAGRADDAPVSQVGLRWDASAREWALAGPGDATARLTLAADPSGTSWRVVDLDAGGAPSFAVANLMQGVTASAGRGIDFGPSLLERLRGRGGRLTAEQADALFLSRESARPGGPALVAGQAFPGACATRPLARSRRCATLGDEAAHVRAAERPACAGRSVTAVDGRAGHAALAAATWRASACDGSISAASGAMPCSSSSLAALRRVPGGADAVALGADAARGLDVRRPRRGARGRRLVIAGDARRGARAPRRAFGVDSRASVRRRGPARRGRRAPGRGPRRPGLPRLARRRPLLRGARGLGAPGRGARLGRPGARARRRRGARPPPASACAARCAGSTPRSARSRP